MTFDVEATRRYAQTLSPLIPRTQRSLLAACDEIEAERKRATENGRLAQKHWDEIERLREQYDGKQQTVNDLTGFLRREKAEVTRLRSLLAEATITLERIVEVAWEPDAKHTAAIARQEGRTTLTRLQEEQ